MDIEYHSLVYSLASDTLPVFFDKKFECSTHFGLIYTVRDAHSMHMVDNASEKQNKAE